LGLDESVSDRVNCRGFSAGENRGFTKVSTEGTEAGLWSTDGVSQMVTYLICDLRKEFFKRVQARFR